jgi:hypothetical protein
MDEELAKMTKYGVWEDTHLEGGEEKIKVGSFAAVVNKDTLRVVLANRQCRHYLRILEWQT